MDSLISQIDILLKENSQLKKELAYQKQKALFAEEELEALERLTEKKVCPNCEGTGSVQDLHKMPDDTGDFEDQNCEECNGEGLIENNTRIFFL
jgi:DnaJ-class molecular chaperone